VFVQAGAERDTKIDDEQPQRDRRMLSLTPAISFPVFARTTELI